MKGPVLFTAMLSILLAACSFTTPVPTVTPASTPTFVPFTPTVIPTSTPYQTTLQVKDEIVNCRFGPGTDYITINVLHQGETIHVIGRNDASNWLYVRDPGNPGGFCWLSVSVMETEEQVEQLPVAPPPFVTVTNVSLRAEPNHIVVNCSQFPQTIFFEAKITANGPTLLKWSWEASTGMSSDVGSMVFEEAGTQVINEFYPVSGPSEYWVKLHILTPNVLEQQVNIPASCTP